MSREWTKLCQDAERQQQALYMLINRYSKAGEISRKDRGAAAAAAGQAGAGSAGRQREHQQALSGGAGLDQYIALTEGTLQMLRLLKENTPEFVEDHAKEITSVLSRSRGRSPA